MKRILAGLSFAFLFISTNVSCQTSYDEAMEFENERKYDEAKTAYLEIIEDENSMDSLVQKAYWRLGDLYSNVSIYDSSAVCYEKGLAIAEEIKDTLIMAEIYLSLNYHYHYQEQLIPAHESILLAEKFFREVGNKKGHGESLMRLGTINMDMSNDSLAFDAFEKGLTIIEELNDPSALATAYQNIGFAHSILHGETQDPDHFHKSMDYFLKAAEQHRSNKNWLPLANALNGIARLHTDKGDFNKALPYLEESMVIAKSEKSGIGMTWNFFGLSENRYLNEDYDKAILYIDSCINTAKEYNILDGVSAGYGMKSEILMEQGNHKDAIEYVHMQRDIQDTIYNNANLQLMQELQIEYETEKKERENVELKNQKKIDDLRTKWIVGSFVLFGLMAVLVINREIKRRKKAGDLYRAEKKVRVLEEEKLKEQLEYKNRELTSMALQIAQKNEMLNSLREELKDLSSSGDGNGKIRQIQNKLRVEDQMEGFWDQFTRQFNETHTSFFQKLTTPYPDLTKNELRLASLIRMNLSTKEMASILNVTDEGIKKARYRMRKKLNLEGEEGLEQHILKF